MNETTEFDGAQSAHGAHVHDRKRGRVGIPGARCSGSREPQTPVYRQESRRERADPALELDDGSVLAETVVICEYLEELHPSPALVGTTPQERAETRMWTRRVEQKITDNMYNGFRFSEGLERFKDRMRCLPEAADGLKAVAQDGLAWLDALMDGKEYVCGDRLTIADLVLYCCMDFAAGVGQSLDPSLPNVSAWFARMDARPSAKTSLHPAAEKAGRKG